MMCCLWYSMMEIGWKGRCMGRDVLSGMIRANILAAYGLVLL